MNRIEKDCERKAWVTGGGFVLSGSGWTKGLPMPIYTALLKYILDGVQSLAEIGEVATGS